MTRRHFVAGAAGTAAALSVGGGLALGRRGGSRGERVIIVGAGFAGLSAAYELGRSGYDAVVLEARDRIGGRVYSVRDPFTSGQHAEAGAEGVDLPHRVLREYVRRFGLGLESYGSGRGRGPAAFVRGRRRRWAALVDWPEIAPFYNRLYELARPLDPEDPAARGAALDGHSVAELIDRVGIRGKDRLVLDSWIRDDYGVEPSELSLLGMAVAERVYFGTSDRAVEVWRISGGNDRLATELARRSGAELRLSTPVTSIERGADRVLVGAGGEEFEAEWCVLAAPLPALRGIAFEPALPAALAGAIDEMQYARVVKTMVQYRTRFWRRRGWSGDTFTDLPLGSAWEATDQQHGREGILISYAAGRTRDRLIESARGDEVAAVTVGLGRVYPNSGEGAIAGQAVDWAGDPYSGGCWMQAAPGQVVPYWRALREPVGRVVLAGEHTSTMPGYMEGGLRSGIAAATTITAG